MCNRCRPSKKRIAAVERKAKQLKPKPENSKPAAYSAAFANAGCGHGLPEKSCEPCLTLMLDLCVARLIETNGRLRTILEPVLRPEPNVTCGPVPTPSVAPLRLTATALRNLIGELNETIDRVDL